MTEESGRTEALISWTIKLFLKANVRIYHWLHAAKKCQPSYKRLALLYESLRGSQSLVGGRIEEFTARMLDNIEEQGFYLSKTHKQFCGFTNTTYLWVLE